MININTVKKNLHLPILQLHQTTITMLEREIDKIEDTGIRQQRAVCELLEYYLGKGGMLQVLVNSRE